MKTLLLIPLLTATLQGACMLTGEHGDYFKDPRVSVTTNGDHNNLRVFDTDQTGTHDPDLEVNGGLALIISESRRRVDDEARGGTIHFRFDELMAGVGLAFIFIQAGSFSHLPAHRTPAELACRPFL